MKITAFAASNSSTSINLALVKYISTYFQNDEVNILNLNDFEMPIYSQDRNNQGVPAHATKFNKILTDSDIIIIGLAEHNGSFTTAFKNIFDWASREDMNVFKQKPMLLLSTSPGARGGASVMESAKSIFPFFGGNIKETFSLPFFFENIKDGEIVNSEFKTQIEEVITNFKSSL